MSNIISLNQKLIDKKEKTGREKKERKILAVQKIFQCIRCAFKCEKCGASIELNPKQETPETESFHIPYNFCEGCKEEYIAYVLHQKGRQDPKDYWRNDQWATLWAKWIEYSGAMDAYLKSREFKQLIQELNDIRSEDEEI